MIRRGILIAALTLVAACGGSDSVASPTAPPVSTTLSGTWSGSMTVVADGSAGSTCPGLSFELPIDVEKPMTLEIARPASGYEMRLFSPSALYGVALLGTANGARLDARLDPATAGESFLSCSPTPAPIGSATVVGAELSASADGAELTGQIRLTFRRVSEIGETLSTFTVDALVSLRRAG